MKLYKTILLILAVVICFSWTAAIEKYGGLEVTITDEDGVPLPGVTCTLTGPAMQGSKTAISNDRGVLRFNLLPAGRWYHWSAVPAPAVGVLPAVAGE